MGDDETTVDSITYTIDTGQYSNMWSSVTGALGSSLNITNGGTGATGATLPYSYSSINTSYTTPTSIHANGSIVCEGDAEFKGDVKVNGKSIAQAIEAIEKRLSILTPDPKKLAKYEALQKAYEHYKTLEAMCYDDE